MKKFYSLLMGVCCLFLLTNLDAQVIEDFETASPTGWTFYETAGDDPGFVQTTGRTHGGSNAFYHNDDNISGVSVAWMVSPSYACAATSELKFWYNQNWTASYYDYSGVWISTTGNNPIASPGDFTELQELDGSAPGGYSEDAWTEYVQSLAAYSGQTIYIAFRYSGDWNHELYIDDFSLDVPPTCLPPTALSAGSYTSTTADVSWTAPATPPMSYDWEVQPTGSAQGSLSVIASGNTAGLSVTATGLLAGSTYDLFVRTNCTGVLGSSTYAGPYTFTIPLSAACGAYSSSPVAYITDVSPVNDVITVTGTAPLLLSDLDLYIAIDHTWQADLEITLTSPAGTTLDLMFDLCFSNNDVRVIFDDEAGSGIATGCAEPTEGRYQPQNVGLSNFDGESFDGNWTLTVVDDAGGDYGDLLQWCLIPKFCGSTGVVLASGSSTTATVQCDDHTGWTYYAAAAAPESYIFAINWAPDGSLSAANSAAKASASTTVNVNGSVISDQVLSITPYETGAFMMERYWDVSVVGALDEAVNVKFFYDPAEKTAAQTARDAAVTALPGTSTSTGTAFKWIKTVGAAFTPSLINNGNDFNHFANVALAESASGTESGVTFAQFDGITSFSGGTGGFGIGAGGSGLPVELVSLEANSVDNSYIRLDWITATEIENAGFEILRSEDGTNFTKIDWVDGNGSTTEAKEYIFNDAAVVAGKVYYYMLNQIDFDGTNEESYIVSASLTNEGAFTIGDFVPNPTTNTTRLSVASSIEDVLEVRVFNNLGQDVISSTMQVTAGDNALEINVEDLPVGAYNVVIVSGNETYSRKIVVTK